MDDFRPERGVITEATGDRAALRDFAHHAIMRAQAAANIAAIVTGGEPIDARAAREAGVHLGRLLVSQPSGFEQALEIAEQLARTGAVDLIILEDVEALAPGALSRHGRAVIGRLRRSARRAAVVFLRPSPVGSGPRPLDAILDEMAGLRVHVPAAGAPMTVLRDVETEGEPVEDCG